VLEYAVLEMDFEIGNEDHTTVWLKGADIILKSKAGFLPK